MQKPARLFLFFVVLMFGLAACGERKDDAADVETWKFAIEEIEGSVQHQYAMEFKRLVEQRSKGKIAVEVYPYGQLGSSAQLTELVQLGSLQFAMASPGHLGAMIPEVQLFSLHFAFSDDDEINRRILNDAGLRKVLNDAYSERNLHLYDLFQEGWMAWTANRPLRDLADFSGLKIRTMNSPLLIKAYELYGANPTTMAYSDVYSSLQLNMIDAQENPVFAIEEMSFDEVQSHLVFPRTLPFVASVVAQPDFFAGLDASQRAMLDEVRAELEPFVFKAQQELNRQRLAAIIESGGTEIIELSDAERQVFIDASAPLDEAYVAMAGERGRQLLDILRKLREENETTGE